ncbi:hypothetical protein GCM10009745_59560 [Kribbella yunnanensis]|uniref:TauD/TfdA-like domain-containing protein n=1 Tax=Kribbella yunnanensis TaxID=190194 RepID=A0ABN2IFV2_9ACTN
MTSPARTAVHWDTLELTNDENRILSQRAEAIASNPYDDLRAFQAAAGHAWSELRVETHERVAALANGTSHRPELHITNLPAYQELDATPSRHVPGRRTADGFLSEFLTLVFTAELGAPVSYRDQREGALFHDVFPTRVHSAAVSSYSSAVPLGFHTEMFFHPAPPDFLVLHCLREGPAATRIAAFKDMVATLDTDVAKLLTQPRFAIDLARLHGSYRHHGRPIAEHDPRPVIAISTPSRLRFEAGLMTAIDQAAARAMHHAEQAADSASVDGVLRQGSLLLLDNRRAVHARSPFDARFDGNDRWLRRTMVRAGTPTIGYHAHPDLELTAAWAQMGALVTDVPYLPRTA